MNSSRWTAILLLFFLAVSAITGAIPMIAHPHGNPLGMPQTMLRSTPFSSFLGPGILLLVFNGLLALWCLFLVVGRRTGYGGWTAFQGIVLIIWLVAECLLLRTVVWAHYLYGVIGAGLLVTGAILAFSQQPQKRNFDY